MSCREPNMQNVPKRADKKEADFVLRRCFKPRPGKVIVSLDYDQVEYRMMLDYAREMALINLILEQGLDVHDATDQALSLGDRDRAKTMNFMLLYGGGVPKLALALYSSEITASEEELKAIWMLYKWPTWRRAEFERDKALRRNVEARGELVQNLQALQKAEAQLEKYFRVLPKVKEFVANVKKKAKDEGVIFTWLGRVLRYVQTDKGHSNYKAPNGLIQGGAGDLSKVALNACYDFLVGNTKNSFLLLHVHDELVLEIAEEEKHIVPSLVAIMQQCYPHRLIPLTAGAAWSEKSWGELRDGVP
jgi:DNA polymerase-1